MTESERTHQRMLAMNEALTLGALRQHELTEAADSLNVQLQKEIAERKLGEAALRESEDRYRSLFNSIDEGFCVIEKVEGDVGTPPDFLYLEANPAFAVQSGMSGMVGKTIRQALPDEPEGWCLIYDTVLRTGEPIRFERDFVTHGRVLELYAFRVEDETHRRVAVIFKDITEHKRAEAALRESEGRFRAIAENIPQLAWMADGEGNVDWFNRGWLDYTGTTLQQNQGAGWKAVHHPDYVDAVAEKFERHLREGRDWEDTFPLRGKDGSYRWFLSRMNVIRDESGKVMRFFGTNTDITNERKAEERQRLLLNELAHRGRNLLAVIQSIASRSLSGTRSLAEARDVLSQRLHALARSQSALTTAGFEGASMAEIIRLEFEAFSKRVEAVGPDMMLNPKVAQTFALLVHELATNATKHGALSGPDGQVSIRWSIEDAGAVARFRFQWQERGGPPVIPPVRQGFGRTVLEKAAAEDFGALPKISFAPAGLIYEIDAPLSVVAAGLTVPPALLGLADGVIE